MSRGWNEASVDERNERSSRWLEFGSQQPCQASYSSLLLFGPPPVPVHMHTDVHKERQAYRKVKIKKQGFSLKNKASRWGMFDTVESTLILLWQQLLFLL